MFGWKLNTLCYRVRKYLFAGVIFGCLFPVTAILFEIMRRQLEFSVENIVLVHQLTPCLFMIDTAPFFLGVFALLAGFNDAMLIKGIAQAEKMAQERTREAKKFSRAIEQAPVSVVITDISGTIEYVNPYFCILTGYTEEEALGANPRILKSPQTSPAVHENLWQTISGGQIWHGEFTNLRKDGQPYWEAVVIAPVKDEAGIIRNYVAIKEDVSNLRQAQMALSHQLAFITRLLDEIPDPVFYEDADCRMMGCNKAYEQAFHVKREDLVGKTILDLEYLPQELRHRYQSDHMQLVSTGETIHQHFQRKFADGKTHEILYSAAGFHLEDGTPGGLIGIMIDISHLKEKEEELEKAYQLAQEATAAKSMFLANMSHEIRTPMNAIIGMSHLALQTELTAKQRDYVQKIQNAGASLLSIINDILDFSKIESNHLEMETVEFSLDDVMNNVVNIISVKTQEKGLELLYKVAADVPKILQGDPLRLAQILTNLVNNAVKFTESGEVTVAVEQWEHHQQNDGKVMLRFMIADSGIGMTAAQINLLFQPFTQADGSTTRRYGGTGLGLTISRRLVEMMDGKIWVKSKPGKGSQFYFTAWFLVAAKQPEVVQPAVLKGLRVLVVDDNIAAGAVLAKYLQQLGLNVDTVNSGVAAIAAVQRNITGKEPIYKFIFMDWQMPEMDGVETASHILEMFATKDAVPEIIIVTAFDAEGVKTQNGNKGIVLTKPVSQSALLSVMASLLAPEKTETGEKNEAVSVKQALLKNGLLVGLRVLLAEDNEINQQIAVELLASQGAVVGIANNGQEAVEKVQAVSGTADAWQVVLMDLHMPVMDGYQATGIILKQEPNLPIIAMTARAMVEEREYCLRIGMKDHISKPIDPKRLFAVVARYAQGKVARQQYDACLALQQKGQAESCLLAVLQEVDGLDVAAGLQRVAGNESLYLKLLGQYVDSQQDFTEKLQQALAAGKLEEAERLAHTLKGVAGNIGAMGVMGLAAALEAALANRMPLSEIEKLLLPVKDSLAVGGVQLQNVLNHLQAAMPAADADVEPGKEQLAPILQRLSELLADNDSEALNCFEENKQLLLNAFSAVELRSLEQALRGFEMEEALVKLKELQKNEEVGPN